MTSYSGLYDGQHGEPHALLSSTVKKGNAETQLARVLSRRNYGRGKLRELMLTLTGAAAGATAAQSHSRVQAAQNLSENVQGGARTIETFESVNRATTSADETAIEAALAQTSQPTTYVADASGNGGGGKLGS